MATSRTRAKMAQPSATPMSFDDLGPGYRMTEMPQPEAAPEQAPPQPSGLMRRVLGDGGIALAKGAIGVSEAAVGLADLASGGRVGKFLENEGGSFGFRPKMAKEILDSYKSPEQQAADRAVQEAQGFVDTTIKALQNPSVILNAAVESVPVMLGGGVVSRSLLRMAPAAMAARPAAPIVAGAAGEGVMTMGSQASDIRQETPDGLLTGQQSAIAAASGAATGLLGYLGGKVAQRMGIADVDTLLTGKASPDVTKGFARRVLEGAVSEGILEELPQSVQEQVSKNLALGRPLGEGVEQAAVLGALAGGLMGAGGNAMSHGGEIRRAKPDSDGPAGRAAGASLEHAAEQADQIDAQQAAAATAPAVDSAATVAATAPETPLDPAGRGVLEPPQDPPSTEAATQPAQPQLPGTPAPDLDNRAARAQREADRPPEPTGDVQPGDIMGEKTGKPFQAMHLAMAALGRAGEGHEIVRVRDGLVVRKTSPTAAEAPELPGVEPAPPAPPDPDHLPDDVLNPKGNPFTHRGAAAIKMRELGDGYTIAKVAGGFAVRRLDAKAGETPAEARPADGQPAAEQPEWQAFPPESKTKGVPRADMPQVAAGDRSALVQFLRARGIDYQAEQEMPARDLKPTQAEYSTAKVQKARDFEGGDRSILVSSDGYIVDGHHQAVAKALDDKPVKAIRLNAPIDQLLPLVREFPSASKDASSQAAAPATGKGVSSIGTLGAAPAPAAAAPAQRLPATEEADARPEIATRWDAMTPEQRQEVAAKAGWSTAKGTTNPQGRAISKKPWAEQIPATRKRLGDAMPAAAQEPATAAPEAATAAPAPAADGWIEGNDSPNPSFKTWTLKHADGRESQVVQTGPRSFVATNANGRPGSGAFSSLEKAKAAARPSVRTEGAPAPTPAVPAPAAAEDSHEAQWTRMPTVEREAALIRAGWAGNSLGLPAMKAKPWAKMTPSQKARIGKALGDQAAAPAPTKDAKGAKGANTVAPLPAAPAPAPKTDKTDKADKADKAEAARAAYFTPGNVVRSYGGGFDEVLSYTPPKDGNAWSVRVHEVVESTANKWVRKGKPQDERTHRTEPDARELARGPAARMPALPGAEVPYSEPRADGQPFTNAPDRGKPAPAAEAPAPAPEPKIDKAEIRPYRREDGSIGYEAVPIVPPAPASAEAAAPAAEPAPAPAEPKLDAPAPSTNTVFTDDAAAKARELLKRKLGGTLNSGIDPEVLQAGITLAGWHIEKGARTFAAYAKAMVADLGDSVKPYLKSWYMGVRFDPRASTFDGMDSAAAVEGADLATVLPEAQAEPIPTAGDATTAAAADNQAQETPTDDSAPSSDAPAVDQPLDAGQRPVSEAHTRGARQPRTRAGRADDRSVRDAAQPDPEQADGQPEVGDARGATAVPDGAVGSVADGGGRVSAADFRPTPGGLKREGSWHATAARNLDLIDLARKIEAEGRQATPAEQAELAKYVGFGASAIRNAIFPVPTEWQRSKAAPGTLIFPEAVHEERWRALAERAAALPTEWQRTILQSTQYAHYTSEGIIRSTWSALQRLGFTGGKIFEPGGGIGSFAMLMPDGVHKTSKFTGIEMDGPTALIARLLSPQQNMLHGDFIKRKLPDNFFDVAVGNPPFAPTKITADPRYQKYGFMLHDYFFAKSIDKVRPGGILAFVTSKGTMDKKNDKARRYLMDRADLIGAIRLPSTAFEDNAGTSVVTDVIFLRKRLPGEAPAGQAWGDVATIETKDGPVVVNQYFAANPHMVLGQQRISGNTDDMGRRINSNGMGGEKYTVVSYDSTPEELDTKFAAAIENLPENVYSPNQQAPASLMAEVAKMDFDPSVKREGLVYLGKDGALLKVEDGIGKPLDATVKLSDKDKAWLTSYVGVRDLVKEAQYAQLSDGDWEAALKKLNKGYDAFVKKHGPINAYRVQTRKSTDEDGNPVESETRIFTNRRLLREDYDSALMTQLEAIDEDGVVQKSAFLKGRTIGKPATREIKTVGDALAVSLDQIGSLNLDDIAAKLKVTRDEAIDALGNQIYREPGGDWVLADQYLSGNVVDKLEEAMEAAKTDPSLERNIEALKEAQPEKLGPSKISVLLGAPWVSERHVTAFAQEIEAGAVSFDHKTETWQVAGGNMRSQRMAGAEYGTAARSPSELLEAILNSRTIKVMKSVPNESGKGTKQVTDTEGTQAANDVAKKIREKFKSWVWQDSERAADLVEAYNSRYNNLAPRLFDGSHLTLPGVSLRFKLHPHQLRAIWRQIQTGNTYLAHAVGAGKTIEMIAGGMEQKRLGLIQKPIYVVPNHMLEQFSNEFMELYPLANIMVADDQNFSKERRKAFVAAATLNAPDAIVITHDAYQRIGMKPESVEPIRLEILADLEDELREAAKDSGARVRRGQLEQQIEAVNQRFDSIIAAGKKDGIVDFEDMGVDMIYADEAHVYRKLDFHTAQSIKGIDPNGSRRALDMYLKARFLDRKRPGRAMVFASGTPVTNTMGELYSIMRFFDPKALDEAGISTFDSWARMFGEVGASLEPNAAGKYEMVERFRKFNNVPELMSRVRSFMDVLQSDQLGAIVKRPSVKTGKAQLIVVEPSEALTEYQDGELATRLATSRAWKPTFEQPNNPDPVIAIISDGRLAAIDPRFIPGARLKAGETTKIDEAASRIAERYKETAGLEYVDRDGKPMAIKGGTQIVFYNLGFGKNVAARRGFDARATFTKAMVDQGVKRNHIVWFDDADTDAKKEVVFKGMRNGTYRVLVGSAKKMGTGVNVQNRLTALHYMDPPWFPSDMEQPRGRILRQGNQNAEIEELWYGTKGGYDSTMFQMVGRKQRFIDQAFSGDKNLRSMDDLGEASMYEQAAALSSGDPRALQLAGLQQDVERLERQQAAHATEQVKARQALSWADGQIERDKQQEGAYAAAFKAIGGSYFQFKDGNIKGQVYTKQTDFGQALKEAFNRGVTTALMDEARTTQGLGTIGNGLKLEMHADFQYVNVADKGETPNYQKRPTGLHELTVTAAEHTMTVVAPRDKMGEDVDALGLARKVVNALNGIESDLRRTRDQIKTAQTDVIRLRKKIGAPFEHEQEMLEKWGELKALEEQLRLEGIGTGTNKADANVSTNPAQTGSLAANDTDVVFSRGGGQSPAAQALAQNDDLFALPRSDKTTVKDIAADIDPTIKVTVLPRLPGTTERYRLGLPNGQFGILTVRDPGRFGPNLYAYDLLDGEQINQVTERPGDNPEDVTDDMQDVYIDVSKLDTGTGGSKVYAIAGALAHNTGRMFIGDPAGLSDIAMRRRAEAMLSLGLRYGTTDFLAPHPRQMGGDKKLGVPALRWIYGDTEGNLKRLIELNVKAVQNGFPPIERIRFDQSNGQFYTAGTHAPVDWHLLAGRTENAEGVGALRQAAAGRRTLARAALLASLVREGSGQGRGEGGRDGVLDSLDGVAAKFADTSLNRLFSRGEGHAQGVPMANARAMAAAIRTTMPNAPQIRVHERVEDAPEALRQQIEAGGDQARVEGAFHDGVIHVFPANIAGAERFMFVVAHHEIRHAGLRSMLGDRLRPTMLSLWSNPAVRAAAQARLNDRRASSREEAVEEALADMPVQDMLAVRGIKGVIAALRNWLRSTAAALRQAGADRLASLIEPAAWTDADVAALVQRSEQAGTGPFRSSGVKAGLNTAATRFSRGGFREAFSQAGASLRDVNLAADYKLGDFMNNSAGKLHWWHNTVGTMRHLADKSPMFKRVYDAVQSFINDTSFFATQASDQAPRLLPKLEHWKDVLKKPISAEDSKALAAPIFEGTLMWARGEDGKPVKVRDLEAMGGAMDVHQKAQYMLRRGMVDDKMLRMWQGLPIGQYEAVINGRFQNEALKAGIVWKDAELRSMFGLTDGDNGTISLYREFRAAVDKSIDNLAISDMLRFAGEDVEHLRNKAMAMGDPEKVALMLRDYLFELAEQQPDRANTLNDTGNRMIDKGDQAKSLKDLGYAPLSRHGQYTLDVVSADGERLYFGLFESRAERAKMARQMRRNYPDAGQRMGTVSEEEYKLMQGVGPETLELFGGMLGLEAGGTGAANEAFAKYIKATKSTRSAMRRLIERKGIEGFSEDVTRVLAGFVYSNARQTAGNLHQGEIADAVASYPQGPGQEKDAAVRLMQYVQNPQEEAQALRGLLFAQYLGGSVASALVNLTQPYTVTLPYLSQWGGPATAAKTMVSAARLAARKGGTGDAQLDAALKVAEERGIVSPQEVHQLQAQAAGRNALQSGDGTKLGNATATARNQLARFSFGWGKLFSMAEQVNRRVTFIAAYRTAVEQGQGDPAAFAAKAVEETQFVMNKGNKPRWARGAVGSVLMTFKQYSVNYLELMQRMWTAGEEGSPERAAGRRAVMLALATLALAGGADGLPFMQDVDDFIDALLQRFGYSWINRQERQKILAGVLGEGGARFVAGGISSLPGMPIDVSGRLGMGNLIPGTGLLPKKANYTSDVQEVFGPVGDLAKRGFQAAGKLTGGDVAGAAETISPTAVRNVTKALDMATTGMYRDDKGRKVLDVDGYDTLAKAIGFQPAAVAKVQQASRDVANYVGQNKLRETEIADAMAQARFNNDPEAFQAARDELADWNRKNPESRIKIDPQQIRKRLRAMNEDKATRMQKTAPKEIRGEAKRMLAEGVN